MLKSQMIQNMIMQFVLFVFGISVYVSANTDLNQIKTYYQQFDFVAEKMSSSLLGLHLENLIKQNQLEAAQVLLEDKINHSGAPRDVMNWWLAKIALRSGNRELFKQYFQSVSPDRLLRNSELVNEIYSLVPQSETQWFVEQLIKSGFFEIREESVCPYFEMEKRKKRGDLIYELVKNHRTPLRIRLSVLHELYVLYPEVIDVSLLRKMGDFDKFYQSLNVKDIVARIETLLIFGKNQAARETYQYVLQKREKLSGGDTCQLSYVNAKTIRKLRDYDLARKQFQGVARECPGEIQLKARYLDALLASKTDDKSSLENFSRFVADYPEHSFSDDVMMFQVVLLTSVGEETKAQSVLLELIHRYPHGDMIERARFLRAMYLRKQKKTNEAIAVLKNLEKNARPHSLERDQARYWIARLAIFDAVSDLPPKWGARAKHALAELRDLVNAPFPHVYSWLAYSLLQYVDEQAKIDRVLPSPAINAPKIRDSDCAYIESLITFGFRTEALHVLSDLVVDTTKEDRVVRIAQYYDALNRPELGHQKLIRCREDVARILRKKIPDVYWKLAYPSPFLDDVQFAERKVDISAPVILAVMRQESGFLHRSTSWANARGLMQLLFSSAKSHADYWGLDSIKSSDLYVPKINLLLGASLLKHYWHNLGSLPSGLAAYNAGPSKARSWVRQAKSLPIDDFIESISYPETRNYVKTVLGATYAYATSIAGDRLPKLEFFSRQ